MFDGSADGMRRRVNLKIITDRRFRWVLLLALLGDLVLPLVLLRVAWSHANEFLTLPTAWGLISFIVIINWWVIRRVSNSYSVAFYYLQVIRKLHENERNWRSMALKRSINQDLRGLSESLARIPFSMRSNSPKVVRSGIRRAAYVNDLQVAVCLPRDTDGAPSSSFAEVRDGLTSSLASFLDNRWEDLPEHDPDSGIGLTRLQRGGFVLVGLALTAAAVFLAFRDVDPSSPFASAVHVGTTLLGAAAYLAFGRAGLVPGSLQQGLDTVDQLRKDAAPAAAD